MNRPQTLHEQSHLAPETHRRLEIGMHCVPADRCVRRPGVSEALPRHPAYRGILSQMSERDAAAQLAELLAYFGLDKDGELPAPVTGQRGDVVGEVDRAILASMRMGIRYLGALAGRKARVQVDAYTSAENLLMPLAELIFEQRRVQVVAEWEASVREAAAEKMQQGRVDRRARKVYFIASDDGPIKIGMAANPSTRLADLQTAHPSKLHLLAVTEGGAYQERRYHTRFAKHHLHGEWFRRCPAIASEIARLNKVAAA